MNLESLLVSLYVFGRLVAADPPVGDEKIGSPDLTDQKSEVSSVPAPR